MYVDYAKINHPIPQQISESSISAEWPFPIELSRHIFSLCSPADVERMTLVSWTFYQLANDEDLWLIFVNKLNLLNWEPKLERVTWREFYKAIEFEKYAKGTKLNFRYLKPDIFGVKRVKKSIMIEIDLNSSEVKGRHLKQIIIKTVGSTYQLNQIAISVHSRETNAILTGIDDKNFLNSYDLKENSFLTYSKQAPTTIARKALSKRG